MKSNTDKLLYVLLACGVQRWHVEPVSRPQNVGEHSGRVALWITLFHKKPSANLLKAALWHDLEERITGDIPHWTKVQNKIFREEIATIESDIRDEYGLSFDISDNDKVWLHAVDLFDAWLFLWEETRVKNNKWMLGDYARASAAVVRKREDGQFPNAIFEVYSKLEQHHG